MKQYLNLLNEVITYGDKKTDRTGTGTISRFSPTEQHYNLGDGFPLVTTKRVFWRGVVEELLWFLSGSTNSKELEDKNVNIWKEWGDPETRELGPVYGYQWRNWNGIDQINNLIEGIKNDPHSRRHIVSAWNVSDLDRMALAPCHCFFQVYVHGTDRDREAGKGYLSLKLYQRSADLFLGVPFNIASYALLTHMIAAQTGYKPGIFHHTIGDAHVYTNHIFQVNLQLSRETRQLPTLHLNPEVKSIFDYKFEDIILENYNPHPVIKGEVSV